MNELEKFLEKVDPSKIGYFTFSKNAAQEGKSRAMEKFNLTDKDLPYFRTLHSFCFNLLGLKKENVMQEKDYRDLGKDIQIEFEGIRYDNDHEGVLHSKDPYISLISLARNKRISPLELYNRNGNNYNITYDKLEIINKELYRYKKQKGLIDFIDMLEKFLDKGESPKFEVIFVDEAQDLSLIQWDIVKKLEKSSKQSIIAGDDDQAIYKWNGAYPENFINLEGEKIILQQSYRVPKKIFNVANSIITKVKNRVQKNWIPKEDLGDVEYHWELDKVDLSKGEWLILARTNYMLEEVLNRLKQEGMFYTFKNRSSVSDRLIRAVQGWDRLKEGAIDLQTVKDIYYYISGSGRIQHGYKEKLKQMDPAAMYDYESLTVHHGLNVDINLAWDLALDDVPESMRMYVNTALRRNEFNSAKNIRVSTIHASKGSEADNVMLLTDLPRKADLSVSTKRDDERRVFYVGATRAKKSLHIIASKTDREFTELL